MHNDWFMSQVSKNTQSQEKTKMSSLGIEMLDALLKEKRIFLINWMEGQPQGWPDLDHALMLAFNSTPRLTPTRLLSDAIEFVPCGTDYKWFSITQAYPICNATVLLHDGRKSTKFYATAKTLELALTAAASKAHMYLLYGDDQPYGIDESEE